jgi:polyether ionophore transport system permease protein
VSDVLTGTWGLTRFQLRRDRILATVWVFFLLLLVYASGAATPSLYPTMQDRVSAAELINASPAAVALYGPILDVTSLGEVAMTKTTVLYGMFVMGFGALLVRRHTRTEEETGRQELLAATVVGRAVPLVAALLEATLVMTAVAVLAAGAAAASGLPTAGSVMFGLSWWGSGIVGVGIGAVASQLSASARTCGLAIAATIGAFYLLRAVGDVGPQWLSWLSPLGWNTQLRAWSDPRLWVLALYPALALALMVGAGVIRGRRDLGGGLLADRPGPATGSPRLRDVLALTLKVHTHALVAWTAAAAVLGAVFGSLVPNLGSVFDSATGQEMLARLGGTGPVEDAMLAGITSVVAMVMTGFAVAVVVRGGVDENDGRTEQVLATATPRGLSFVSVLVVAQVGLAWLLVVIGVSTGIGYGAQSGLAGPLGRSLAASLVSLPAAWLVGALAMLCLSLGSRWAAVGWVLLVGFATVQLVGELLDLPGWVLGLSPYEHVAKVPSEPMEWTSAIVLTLLAAGVSLAAWFAYRGRDIG